MYDIIGDIHGYATPLRALLQRMGYAPVDGVWQHPERKVIFVGDFIDRGPGQVEVALIARDMVVNGHAHAVMGNHELNAIAWAMPDPEAEPGTENGFMRPHIEKNLSQHRAFLEQVGEGSSLHTEIIDWFKTLPLYLELDGLRVVHACWDEASLACLAPLLDSNGCVKPNAWVRLLRKGTPHYEAGETLLKGLEVDLPEGLSFLDKDGHPRHHIRTKWWSTNTPHLTYRDLAIVPPHVLETIPHVPVPADLMPGYAGDKLLFVGHYWLTGKPQPLSDHIACLDYSIAAQDDSLAHSGGKLCAYRYDGETSLREERFVWVEGESTRAANLTA